jgi:tetratricopeptide (TPR) repeat protein
MTSSGRILRRPLNAATGFAIAAAACLASASPAAGAPSLTTLSESRAVPSPIEALAELRGEKPKLCPGRAAGGAPTLAGALRQARMLVLRNDGRGGLQAFERSKQARTASRARASAAGALAGNRPHAALAALLRAQKLEPRNPTNLVNLAGVLNMLGQPRLALAASNAAERKPGRLASPMGMDGEAMALNNRGQALIGVGRARDAVPLLRRAVAREPELSEAKVNLAAAELCRGDEDEAVAVFRRGHYRKKFDFIDKPGPGGKQRPPIREIFDLSRGQDGVLPHVAYPGSWDVMRRSAGDFQGLIDEAFAQDRARVPYLLDLRERAESARLHPATRRRYEDIQDAIGSVGLDPVVRELEQRWQVAEGNFLDVHAGHARDIEDLDDLARASENQEAVYQGGCPDINFKWHGRWLATISAYDTISREYFAAHYRFRSGLAAHVATPVLHDLLTAQLEGKGFTQYTSPLSEARYWAGQLELTGCNPGSGGPPELDATGGENPEPEACSRFLRGVKFAIKVEVFKLSINCEEISGELGPRQWIGPFVEGKGNFVKGTLTVFGGVKASGKIPETNIGVSAKEGVFVTVGSTGIKDAGIKVTTTGSFGTSTGHSVDIKGPGYTLGFVSQTIDFQ